MTQDEFNRTIVELLDHITAGYDEMSPVKSDIRSLLEWQLPVDAPIQENENGR